MSEGITFDFLADELSVKAKGLGNMGVKLKFVFEGMGAVHIDATQDIPVVTRDELAPADVTITAPLNVWLDLRAKKLAPHVAAMTKKIKLQGDILRGMKLAPRIMKIL
ncbi:MAG: SCP2 sterol-binding domain-containing protein [Burkholderiales bacterium]